MIIRYSTAQDKKANKRGYPKPYYDQLSFIYVRDGWKLVRADNFYYFLL